MDAIRLPVVDLLRMTVLSPLAGAHHVVEGDLPQHVIDGTSYFGATTAHRPGEGPAARIALRRVPLVSYAAGVEELRRRHGRAEEEEIVEDV